MTNLSDTARVILSRAAQHEMGLAFPTASLKGGAIAKVGDSLLKQNMVTAIQPRRGIEAAWTVRGEPVLLKITDEGLRAIGIDPNAGDDQGADGEPDASGIEGSVPAATAEDALPPYEQVTGADREEAPHGAHEGEEHGDGDEGPQDPPAATTRAHRLRDAAAAFLAAWDACPAQDATDNPISRAVENLRGAMAPKPTRNTTQGERKPREGTKREAVIALLKRGEGTTIDEIMEATDWQAHTVRGFFAALKKQGWHISTTETARNPNDTRRGKMLVYRA